MSAVEEIQAAIDKLTELRQESQGNEWLHEPGDFTVTADGNFSIAEDVYPYDASLMATLHRTIDAQLAILADGLKVAEHFGSLAANIVGSVRIPIDHALPLARAINGGTQ